MAEAVASDSSNFEFSEFAEELLENIFCCNILDFKDVLNLSLVCRRFHSVTRRSNELWKKKLLQKWPSWSAPIGHSNYVSIFKSRYHVDSDIVKKLQEVSKQTYTLDDIPNDILHGFDEILEDEFCMNMVLDSLQNKAQQSHLTGNINIKYYAEKVFRYVYHHNLKLEWLKLLSSCVKSVYSLEEGAILIAKWCNPSSVINGSDVTKALDDIAESVKEKILSVLGKTVIQHDQVKEVLNIMNKVLFKDLLFQGNSNAYYNITNSYIHEVLKTKKGIPISLSVIYIAIGRRLGLQICGINFPGHFLVQVKTEKLGVPHDLFVDAFNEGELLDRDGCLQKFMPHIDHLPYNVFFEVSNERRIFVRMTANIVNILRQHTSMDARNMEALQSALELMLLLAPEDDEHRLLLSRIHLYHGINLEEVVENLQGMFSSNRGLPVKVLDSLLQHAQEKLKDKTKLEVKYRSDEENIDVKFRVGMVMKHKLYHYYFVILGWDSYCKMDINWQQQMGVYNLKYKEKQPYYSVLAHDGSCRYAAQENVLPIQSGRPIQHAEVGKHFVSFNGFNYEATSMLIEQYPEDQPIPFHQRPPTAFIDPSDELP